MSVVFIIKNKFGKSWKITYDNTHFFGQIKHNQYAYKVLNPGKHSFRFVFLKNPRAPKAKQIPLDIIDEEITTEPNKIYYLTLFKTNLGYSLDNLDKKSIEGFRKNKFKPKKSEYYFLGKNESQLYYDNKNDRGFNTISTLNGIIFPFGIVTQVLLSNLHKPTLSNYLNPNHFLLASNEHYYKGYMKGAKSKMLKRGWRNFGIGVSINFAIVVTWWFSTGQSLF